MAPEAAPPIAIATGAPRPPVATVRAMPTPIAPAVTATFFQSIFLT
ncbi:hypothetical protein [Streptococcus suis]|nr:hypothetical protein [Streptococcus suis]MBO4131923.1 hypothetical protein [Streptococcus suis]MBO4133095.1 hypothetical protein [Streptococcus suis]MCO8185211.1 hypothetical protein [Streptococcus suis]MCO8216804.1 hypothetical protein [Streptococcus suis]NQK13383.1 hypothetical protein [Streptococcus suis]